MSAGAQVQKDLPATVPSGVKLELAEDAPIISGAVATAAVVLFPQPAGIKKAPEQIARTMRRRGRLRTSGGLPPYPSSSGLELT
jgi:hypothetical protein